MEDLTDSAGGGDNDFERPSATAYSVTDYRLPITDPGAIGVSIGLRFVRFGYRLLAIGYLPRYRIRAMNSTPPDPR
ncbi:MAG TPA: hypothetical protein VIH54_07735, partial [Chthoniobacterales bacterium]